jgi:hypothetical protein
VEQPIEHLSTAEIEAGLDFVRSSPRDGGSVDLIVRRPAVDEREVVAEAVLDAEVGLMGDNWRTRGSTSTEDGSSNPEAQVTIMNSRLAGLVARDPERRQLAGDQLYVDLDLSEENLPAGTRLAVGSATLEVSAKPHTGCAKFSARFGPEAARFVNSPVGRQLRLRGLNAKVVVPGKLQAGDSVRKISAAG